MLFLLFRAVDDSTRRAAIVCGGNYGSCSIIITLAMNALCPVRMHAYFILLEQAMFILFKETARTLDNRKFYFIVLTQTIYVFHFPWNISVATKTINENIVITALK